ncbi:MAG: signal peptide peptidase SppA [Fibrobacteria bacterium]|nr:signal peptide peptidase SppA [Fibrobacteria bacterium]
MPKAELSGASASASMKLMPLRYKAELSGASASASMKLMPLRYQKNTGLFAVILLIAGTGLATLSFSLDNPFLMPFASPLSRSAGVFGNPGGSYPDLGQFGTLGLSLKENADFNSVLISNSWTYFGLGYRYTSGTDHHEYALHLPIINTKNFHGGALVKYQYFNSDVSWSLDFGMQYSPLPFVQLGYYTKEMLHSKYVLDETHIMGVGLRPLGLFLEHSDIWTVAYEAVYSKPDFKSFDNVEQYLASDLHLFNWIHLQGRINPADGSDFSLGLFTQLSPNSLIAYNRMQTRDGRENDEFILQSHQKVKSNKTVTPGRVVLLDLNTFIIEGYKEPGWFERSDRTGHQNIMALLKSINQMSGIEILILKTGHLRCGWAIAEDLRNGLLALQKKGITIISYMESVSRLDYYIASVANRVVVQPSCAFNLRGFSTETLLTKGLLDKIGVEAQFLKEGKYKSFPEMFTRDSVSVEWKDNMRSIMGNLWSRFLNDVAASRNIAVDSLANSITTADLSLSHARTSGLIDTALFEDQLMEYAGWKDARATHPQYQELLDSRWYEGRSVALILIEGSLMQGSSNRGGLFSMRATGSETLVALLQKARLDDNIGAVVLRINSPGGSAVASDIILREIELVRKEGKPVIVSMGNVCASGGYYIACGGDVLIAQKNTILGSIGVFGGKFVVKGLYEKLGLKKAVVVTEPHADAVSDYRHWTEKEAKAIQGHLHAFYSRFTNIVSRSRKLSQDSTERVSQGRVFTGEQAVQNGLVDKIGNLEMAITLAKQKMKVGRGEEIRVVRLEPRDVLFGKYFARMQTSPVREMTKDISKAVSQLSTTNIWALSLEGLMLGAD